MILSLFGLYLLLNAHCINDNAALNLGGSSGHLFTQRSLRAGGVVESWFSVLFADNDP